MALKQWGGPWFSGGHLMNQNVLILPKTAFEHFCGKPTHQRGQSYQPVHMGADREEKSNDNGKEKTSSELTVWICGCFPVHLQLVFPAFRCRFKFPVFPLLVGLLAPQARWLHPSAGLSVAALSVRWCPAHRQDCWVGAVRPTQGAGRLGTAVVLYFCLSFSCTVTTASHLA